jgi:hypothetical protein
MLAIVRRTAAIVALIAAGVLLAACGKSAHFGGEGSSHPRPPAGSSARAGKTLDEAQAKALAPRLNLQAGDLPGFQVSSRHARETTAEKGAARKLGQCVGGQDTNEALAEAGSQSFERQAHVLRVSVSSSVTIAQTAAAAAMELRAIRGPRVQTCLTRFLDELLEGETRDGASAKLVSVSKTTPPALGTAGAYAWRIVGEIAVKGVHIPFYVEIVGFAYGQDEVQLFSFGLPVPFPAFVERELFTLLVERAKAAGSARPRKGPAPPKTPGSSAPQRVEVAL